MAVFFTNSYSLSFFFLLFSCIPFVYSLSTIAISETGNQALICSLNRQSFLNCSSFPSGFQIPQINISFSGIVAGNGFLCGLKTFPSSSTSIIVCWRFSENSTNLEFKQIYQGPSIKELRSGNSHFCGLLNSTNRLQCWQWRRFNFNFNFSTIAVGGDFVCGISELGKMNCNGSSNSSGLIGIRSDRVFLTLAAGSRHVCAIELNNELSCWGDMAGEIPTGKFKSLALGENRSCGLRFNGTVICWGENGFFLPVNLQGEFFTAIEAKRSIFCGILRKNFSLVCWGNQIFNNESLLFDEVLPGPCRSDCKCGPLANTADFCTEGFVICNEPCSNDDKFNQISPPPPPPPQSEFPSESSGRHWSRKMIALLVIGSIGSFSLLLISSFFLFKYCKSRACRIHDSGRLDEEHEEEHEEQQQQQTRNLDKRLSNLVSLENFPIWVLLEATNNFSDECKIGTGSFGSVYHGVLEDGREVAIKRASTETSSKEKDTAFINELESLSRINHKNLVRLLGFFEDTKERVLVYEFMSNGSLHDHLHKQNPSEISWAKRIGIALDAARGILYLHEYINPPIIHRDIKSSNILLNEQYRAKVADFGLSLMAPDSSESHLSMRAAGTVGYMDPEYYRLQKLTTKSDVYSFGVVMLEMLSGMKAIHRNENGVPRNVVDVVVPYIVRDEIHRVLDRRVGEPTPYEIEAVKYVGYLAADCVLSEGRNRPSMADVVSCLERAVAACSPPASFSRASSESITYARSNEDYD